MSFPGWCMYRASEARRLADDAYREILRRRFSLDAAHRRSLLLTELDQRVNQTIAEWEALWS